MASRVRPRLLLTAVTVAVTGLAVGFMLILPISKASAATATFYASPTGSGASCTQAAPCSLTGAQSAVRARVAAEPSVDAQVMLADGTYRLNSTWKFTAADSGSAGHPVVWRAAPGAFPLISGATRVTGWAQEGTSGVWSATVPSGSATRQLYVDGKKVPVAGRRCRTSGGRSGSGRRPDTTSTATPTAMAWFGARTAAELAQVEFDYPGGNGPWTESRCPVAS